MKKLLFVGLLFLAVTSFASKPTIDEVRLLYEKSDKDESSCNKLIEILSVYNEKDNPLYAGYKASAIMMMAKHVFNPFSKCPISKNVKKFLKMPLRRMIKMLS